MRWNCFAFESNDPSQLLQPAGSDRIDATKISTCIEGTILTRLT